MSGEVKYVIGGEVIELLDDERVIGHGCQAASNEFGGRRIVISNGVCLEIDDVDAATGDVSNIRGIGNRKRDPCRWDSR